MKMKECIESTLLNAWSIVNAQYTESIIKRAEIITRKMLRVELKLGIRYIAETR